jgi:hypothetical protein
MSISLHRLANVHMHIPLCNGLTGCIAVSQLRAHFLMQGMRAARVTWPGVSLQTCSLLPAACNAMLGRGIRIGHEANQEWRFFATSQ